MPGENALTPLGGFAGGKFTTKLAYDGSGNLQYLGKALAGSATSAAKWQICKFTWSGSNLTDIQYADGVNTFTKVWDSRAGYSYA